MRVSPIDALADKADDRALADSLAFAATSKNLSATRSAPTPTSARAPQMPAHLPANTAPALSTPVSSQARGQTKDVRSQGASPMASAAQVQAASAAPSMQNTPQSAARGLAPEVANLNISAGEAGSAAELFQQALAQSKMGVPKPTAASSASRTLAESTASHVSVRPAPAPPVATAGQRQVSTFPAARQVEPQVSQVQAAPAPASSVQTASPAPPVSAQANVVQPQPASVQPAAASQTISAAQPVATQPAYAPSAAPAPQAPAPAPTAATATVVSPLRAPAAVASPTVAPLTDSSEAKPSGASLTSTESEPPQEEKTRWWQRKRKAKKAEAPEQEDTRAGAWQESADEEGEEEPLTFIQTFLRWVLRLSVLLIIALGMVLTMDRPVISQTMGQDIFQPGIVDNVTVTQI